MKKIIVLALGLFGLTAVVGGEIATAQAAESIGNPATVCYCCGLYPNVCQRVCCN